MNAGYKKASRIFIQFQPKAFLKKTIWHCQQTQKLFATAEMEKTTKQNEFSPPNVENSSPPTKRKLIAKAAKISHICRCRLHQCDCTYERMTAQLFFV